jgi:hypothetical protein
MEVFLREGKRGGEVGTLSKRGSFRLLELDHVEWIPVPELQRSLA